MAAVTMHQIKVTVDKALRYIVRSEATQGGLLVSTTAAVIDPSDWRTTAESFEASRTLRRGAGRKSSVLAHHVIQSFAPGEITSGAQAHDIGVAFADRITQGRFEYTLATHMDKGHVHNHLIINAVSHIDGKALRVQKHTLAEYREFSNDLSREHGLSVIERDEAMVRPALREVYARARGVSRHEQVRLAIDRAVSSSTNWLDFELTLESQGVEVSRSQKRAVTYRTESMGRAVRDARLGPAYEEGAVMARLGGTSVLRFDAHDSLVVPPSVARRTLGEGSTKVSTDKHAVTIKLPGTDGARCITVHPDQVVRHGKTLRIYLPEHSTQAILNRNGGIEASVPTKALYAAFAPPARDLVRRHQQIEGARGLRGGQRVREQVERLAVSETLVNVRGRFGILTGEQALAHVGALVAEIERAESTLQTLAVALDESPAGSQERADLHVQLASATTAMSHLQTAATELVTWAQTGPARSTIAGVERDEVGATERSPALVPNARGGDASSVEETALRERLADVKAEDLRAVGMPAARIQQLQQPPAHVPARAATPTRTEVDAERVAPDNASRATHERATAESEPQRGTQHEGGAAFESVSGWRARGGPAWGAADRDGGGGAHDTGRHRAHRTRAHRPGRARRRRPRHAGCTGQRASPGTKDRAAGGAGR